jgi:uncharacterized SAM-binding protein YcdF (DUF218 family)
MELAKQPDDDLLQIIWDYMVIESPLAHADVILAGGCTDIGVATYAAELYNTGFAPKILFSGYRQPGMDITEADLFAGTALALGVPESAILKETVAANTGQNITLSQALLTKHGIIPKTVILVHKSYMSRRFLATAEAQWREPKPVFITRHEEISRVAYTMQRGRGEVIQKMLGDFQRMRPYAKKGFQSAQVIPDEVQQAYDTLLWRGHKTR